jgi:hypothetical protein
LPADEVAEARFASVSAPIITPPSDNTQQDEGSAAIAASAIAYGSSIDAREGLVTEI